MIISNFVAQLKFTNAHSTSVLLCTHNFTHVVSAYAVDTLIYICNTWDQLQIYRADFNNVPTEQSQSPAQQYNIVRLFMFFPLGQIQLFECLLFVMPKFSNTGENVLYKITISVDHSLVFMKKLLANSTHTHIFDIELYCIVLMVPMA